MYNKYYYLISSLPYLVFGKAAPLTPDSFLLECAKWLTPGDMEMLYSARVDNFEPPGSRKGLIKEWMDFDISLRSDLKAARIARGGGHEERVHGLVKDIYDHPDPLAMERRFEEIRWNFLDESELDRHFDINELASYYLKLQILERLSRFDAEAGGRVYERACEVRYE